MYTYLIYLFFWTFFFNVRLIQCVEADRWNHMNWWYHQLSSEKFLAGFTFGFTLASKLLISNNSHPMVITFSILSTWLNSHCQTVFFSSLSLSLLLSSLYMCPIDTLCSCQTRQTSGNETHRNAQSSYFLHQTTLFWCFPQQDGHGRFRANLAADGYSSPDNPVVDFLSWNWNIGRNVVHPWNSTGNLKKEVCRKRRCVFFFWDHHFQVPCWIWRSLCLSRFPRHSFSGTGQLDGSFSRGTGRVFKRCVCRRQRWINCSKQRVCRCI